jgi:uncharacterized protein
MAENRYTTATGRIGKIVAIHLDPGCDVLQTLTEVAEKEGIKSGIIIGGAGSIRTVTLRNPRGFPDEWPITDKWRIYTPVTGPLEMTAIAGNIAHKPDGSLFVHGHITVSTGCPESIAYGGHLIEGCIIQSTGEIVIAEVEGMDLARIYSEETKTYEFTPVQK